MGRPKRFHWSVDLDAILVWGAFALIAISLVTITVALVAASKM